MKRINEELETELRNAKREVDERQAELIENLNAELDEKRKQIEHEYLTMDLAGGKWLSLV